jgi:hypothetical protein
VACLQPRIVWNAVLSLIEVSMSEGELYSLMREQHGIYVTWPRIHPHASLAECWP